MNSSHNERYQEQRDYLLDRRSVLITGYNFLRDVLYYQHELSKVDETKSIDSAQADPNNNVRFAPFNQKIASLTDTKVEYNPFYPQPISKISPSISKNYTSDPSSRPIEYGTSNQTSAVESAKNEVDAAFRDQSEER